MCTIPFQEQKSCPLVGPETRGNCVAQQTCLSACGPRDLGVSFLTELCHLSPMAHRVGVSTCKCAPTPALPLWAVAMGQTAAGINQEGQQCHLHTPPVLPCTALPCPALLVLMPPGVGCPGDMHHCKRLFWEAGCLNQQQLQALCFWAWQLPLCCASPVVSVLHVVVSPCHWSPQLR